MSLHIGDQVEHFAIVGLLGEGGMGQVYLARDTRLERMVALKIVRPGKDGSYEPGDDRRYERLLREARAAAALEHPNVVTIYEVGEIRGRGKEAGRPFIAMELVKGRSLRSYIGDAGVPIADRVRWLADVARALGAAHRAGLVHRDIKPENVMIRDDGVVKVLDFGVAKRAAMPAPRSATPPGQVLSSLTGVGVTIGTPYYMAPEQMRREELDGRADQFAWGVMAYELLSGNPPWGRDVDSLEVVSRLLTESPPPLRGACPDVPREVAAVVARAMAKPRSARFESMEALVAALGDLRAPAAITGSGRVAAGPVPSPTPPTSELAETLSSMDDVPARRRPSAWRRTIGVVAGAAAVATLVATGLARRARTVSRAIDADAASSVPCVRAADCAHAFAGAVCVAGSCAPPKGCTSHAECRRHAGGAPALCHFDDGSCAPLETAACKVNADPAALDDDATLWIGTLFPRTGPDAADFGEDNARGVVLARDDFRSTVGGVPLPGAGARPRPIGLVECDDTVDPFASAMHLARDVRAPAVIGFHTSKEAIDLAAQVFVPNRMLVVAAPNRSAFPSAASSYAPGDRLVWRTTPDPSRWAAPVAALLAEHVEPALRASRKVDDHYPLRLAILRPKNGTGLTLSYALMRTVRFNGKAAAENGELLREVLLDDDAADADFAGAATDLLAFQPDLVLLSTSGDTRVVQSIETAWPRGRPRPRYVSMVDFRDEAFVAFLRASPDLRRRIFDVHPVMDTIANRQLTSHFDDVFKVKYPIADVPSASYDAGYLVLYAAAALGDGPLDGASLARAMPRLEGPGETIDVGPARLFDGVGALRAGRPIDLNGADSRLDYGTESAAPATDFAVYCIGTEVGGDGRRESGLRFDATTQKFLGTLACPPN